MTHYNNTISVRLSYRWRNSVSRYLLTPASPSITHVIKVIFIKALLISVLVHQINIGGHDQFQTKFNRLSGVMINPFYVVGVNHFLVARKFYLTCYCSFCCPYQSGPRFFLLTGQCICHRWQGSYLIAVDIALGNAGYIVLTIIGWSGSRNIPLLSISIEILGAIYLSWLGWQLITTQASTVKLKQATSR